jgi:hypothetical protein
VGFPVYESCLRPSIYSAKGSGVDDQGDSKGKSRQDIDWYGGPAKGFYRPEAKMSAFAAQLQPFEEVSPIDALVPPFLPDPLVSSHKDLMEPKGSVKPDRLRISLTVLTPTEPISFACRRA